MQIKLNGKTRDVERELTLSQLLQVLERKPVGIAVAVNMRCIPMKRFDEVRLQENDEVEILVANQGG